MFFGVKYITHAYSIATLRRWSQNNYGFRERKTQVLNGLLKK